MSVIDVDGLSFSFDDDWLVAKYDEWIFYRNRFSPMMNGIKAIDLLAVDRHRVAWLIEVKDYTSRRRTNPSDLGDEVCQKVIQTLAAMLPCKLNASETAERQGASRVLRAKVVRVVLHLEQPAKNSKLFPRAINPANIALKLEGRLKAVDPHPVVAEMNRMGSLGWTVGRAAGEP